MHCSKRVRGKRYQSFRELKQRCVIATTILFCALAVLLFSPVYFDHSARAQTPITCAAINVTANTILANESFVGTSDYAAANGDSFTSNLSGALGTNIFISLAGQILADVTLGATGSATASFTVAGTLAGRFTFIFTGNTPGVTASANITCNVAGPPTTGSIDVEDAIAQVAGTLPVTNPEIIDGNVFGTFNIPTDSPFDNLIEDPDQGNRP